jgi:hypothetical protein
MRSKIVTVATVVASLLLGTQMATADEVQEQLRLMEQRMAEMEDRLQATSEELSSAQKTVDQQQNMLSEAGLVDEDEGGFRSAVGEMWDMIDVTGVVAASFNYRLVESDIDTNGADGTIANGGLVGGNSYFKHPNSNTFEVDQVWITIDKTPTDDSRGGMHVEFVTGTAADAQGGQGDSQPYLYSGWASYLAPIGNGVEIDLGRLATPLGAEVVQTNGNYFVTQGNVFALQPVTHTGVSFSTDITDGMGFIFGVVNEVYSDTFVSTDNDKAYYGQFQFGGESWGLNVGGIIGDDDTNAAAGCNGCDTRTSVVDVTATADPTENLSMWANFDWVHTNGADTTGHGDAFGVSVAGRLGFTDTMGFASRFEYVWTEDTLIGAPDDGEVISLTGTLDKMLADNLVTRLELRWDHSLEDNAATFANQKDDQLVALWEMYYEF